MSIQLFKDYEGVDRSILTPTENHILTQLILYADKIKLRGRVSKLSKVDVEFGQKKSMLRLKI